MDLTRRLQPYYAAAPVRARLAEFFGGRSLADATAHYLLAYRSEESDASRRSELAGPLPPHELPQCLDRGCDIARSLWDRTHLIAHLDIEYVNFDFPGEAYLNPWSTFRVQRPVIDAIQEILLEFGIVPLHLMTGRGHHFVWSIAQDSPVFHTLARLGRPPETLQQHYREPHSPRGDFVESELGRAFAGLGLVMEHLAQLVKERAASHCIVPVQLTDIEVGEPGPDRPGREAISIDVSEYADPLHTRHIRAPFSVYLKPYRNRAAVGDHVVDRIPLLFEIPLFEISEADAIEVMRDAEKVADLARRASVRIPDETRGTDALMSSYESSDLFDFHCWFYAQEQHPPCEWADTYDQTPVDQLPSCAREILQQPNDLLLKPAGMQHVVRVFMALGWHPRHIAGLIRSRYERDYGWGQRWEFYDAQYRADSYTRLFAGLIATGRDQMVDLNCVSNREKGMCFEEECGHNLADYRDALAARRDHERLGCRPFNRLFLSDKHF